MPTTAKIKIATCQFPISGCIDSNAAYIHRYIKLAAANNARLHRVHE